MFRTMPKRNRALLGLGLLVLAILAFAGIYSYSAANRPPEPTPTPVPTLAPTATPEPAATKLLVAGGDIFVPMSHDHVLRTANLDIATKRISTFEIKNDPGLGTEIQCVWPGTESAFNDFRATHPTMVLTSEKVFSTYNMLMTRADEHLPWFIQAGLAHQESDGRYVFDKMYETLQAAINDRKWAELFIEQGLEVTNDDIAAHPWMNLQVNIATSAPERSSGGQSGYFTFAAYLAAGGNEVNHVVTLEEIESVMPQLKKLWDEQSLQDTSSPSFFRKWVAESYSTPLGFSSESLFLGWYNALPQEKRETDGSLIVGMYPPVTTKTDHILAAIHPDCVPLVELFRNDTELHRLGWEVGGMRTAAGGISDKPGNTDVSWISANALSIGEPKREVFEYFTSIIRTPSN